MRQTRSTRWLPGGLLLLLLAASPTAAAEEEGGVGSSAEPPRVPSAVDLLAPIGERLSGRPWLITEGLDATLATRPGFDALTGLDWRSLEGATGPGAPGRSPIMQGSGGGALVPYRDPGPAFSRNLLVTRDFGQVPYQTEPHLGVNPQDPDHLVLGTIDYGFPSVSSYVSFDGGERWEGPYQVPYLRDDLGAGGDPVVGFDREGTVFMTTISMGEEEFNVGPVVISTFVSSIAVARSENGGIDWPDSISSARSRVDTEGLEPDRFGRLRGTLSIGFLDKPWLTVGPDPADPERDLVHVTYTDFDVRYEIVWVGEIPAIVPVEVRTTIRATVSADGGSTWSEPIAVSPTVREGLGEGSESADTPGVVGTKRTVQGSQPVVGPDGTVTVAWLDSTDDEAMKESGEIYVARSTDGGRSFSAPLLASSFNELPFRPHNAFFRYWASAFPQLAVGPGGELHIVYIGRPSDRLGDDGDVYLVTSTDGGETWSRPRRLNDDDGDALQFFPSVDVDPSGAIHVMWGDMRDDPAQIRYFIYYTQSKDGGETFGFDNEELGIHSGDTRVSDFASNANKGFSYGLFLGDYFNLQATEEDVYMVWADTRLGEYGGPNQKIGFARQRSVPSPEIFISPPAGPGGQQVTVQGFEFQPDMNVYLQLGDSTISTMRTDKEGQFSARLYIPLTSQGDQALSAFDESGNGAATSFYTEFGFGDIAKQLQELRELVEQGQGGTGDGS